MCVTKNFMLNRCLDFRNSYLIIFEYFIFLLFLKTSNIYKFHHRTLADVWDLQGSLLG